MFRPWLVVYVILPAIALLACAADDSKHGAAGAPDASEVTAITAHGVTTFQPSERKVSLASLLAEMIDRDRLARLPDPDYQCLQFSSYDRASTSIDNRDTWFANYDRGHHLREEENAGRKEWVMMDIAGPGAVSHIWSANPMGTLRIYLDNHPKPVIEAPMAVVLDGKWKVGAPLAQVKGRGHNLYLPIPYAKHCKITNDERDFYYIINYRTYEPGTPVETFTLDGLDDAQGRIADVSKALLLDENSIPWWIKKEGVPGPEIPSRIRGLGGPIPNGGMNSKWDNYTTSNVVREANPGESVFLNLPNGPKVVHQLTVNLPSLPGRENTESNRSLVLCASFDGVQTIWCPLSDFFGAGPGAEIVKDFYRFIDAKGNRTSLWPMPYKEKAEISVLNLGEEPVMIALRCLTEDWKWDDRSMHFYSRWRYEHPLPTRPMRDWNYVEVKGQGVYVGDTLAMMNPVATWWGEGDEKIYVDGETFPSHFGTGTEDYYCYAWGCNEPFLAPFHGQPRCDGRAHGNCWGNAVVSRVRSLDAIPFDESFKLDIEVWHWRECEVAYAATCYFYARPGAMHNRMPLLEAARAPIPVPPPLPPPYKIEGVLECEAMEVAAKSGDVPVEVQAMRGFGREVSSGEAHLWVRGREPGDFVELKVPVPADGKHKISIYATRSWDYGIIRFSINGKTAGDDTDLFNHEGRRVAPTGPIDLGVFEARGGHLILRAEVVGGHPDSEGTKSYFGLDCVRITPLP